MAVFTHRRAFDNATPVDFRAGWRGDDHPHATPPKLAGAWSTDRAGRLVWRWRMIAAGPAL